MKNRGITIIALVITIIVLLILAGVTITVLTGNNGILNQANKAVNQSMKARIKEELELKIAELGIEYETDESLKEMYLTVGDYIKDKLKGYQFSNGLEINYKEEDDEFSFSIEGEEATFQINDNGNITNLTFSGTTSGGNQKDTISPIVNIVSTTTNSITFYATDNVGIVSYAITEANEEPIQWEEVEQTQELEKTITGLVNNKTYYIWAKDEEGNRSEALEVKTIDFESLEHTLSWSGSKATINITAPTSGVQYRLGTTGSWNNVSTSIEVESGTTVQFIITDGTNETTVTTIIPRLTGLQLTYDVNTGTGTVPASQTYTHEDKVTVDFTTLPTKTGYTFNGWSTNQNATSAEFTQSGTTSFTMPVNAVTLYAIWIPNTGTDYKVVHRQMNVTGSGYTTVTTENLKGTTGASITPPVKTYTGFTSPTTKTTTIAGDGSTTVTYDYIRNQYTFTLGSATGVSTTGSSPSGKYYYGATITLRASVSTEYIWDKWTGSNSSFTTTTANKTITMPASNLTMTPVTTLKPYEVTLDNKDATILGTTKIYVKENKVYTDANASIEISSANPITIPVRPGYIFAGYYTGTGGTETQILTGSGNFSYLNTDRIGNDRTLYAHWSNPVPNLDCSYDNVNVTYSLIGDGSVKIEIESTNTRDKGCSWMIDLDKVSRGGSKLKHMRKETLGEKVTINYSANEIQEILKGSQSTIGEYLHFHIYKKSLSQSYFSGYSQWNALVAVDWSNEEPSLLGLGYDRK